MTNSDASPGDWVGRLIDGKFGLLEWLGSTESGDIFLTELPEPHAQRAAIRLVSAATEDALSQLDDWTSAEALSHPHLIRIHASGRGRIVEDEFIYVVTEFPDESLAQVLPERPLTTAEAADMLGPAVDALEYLHSRSLVHGHIDPANILVVGDQVKLSADKLLHAGTPGAHSSVVQSYAAPESAEGSISSAADVWSIGVTLVHALTQRPPVWEPSAGSDPIVPESVPEPFASIARSCLRVDPAQRCSLVEIRRDLRAPVPAVAPKTPAKTPPAGPPANPAIAAPPPTQTEFTFEEARPSRRPLRSMEDTSDVWALKGRTPWLIGAAVLLVVFFAALLVRSHKTATAPVAESGTSATPAEPASPQAKPAPTPGARGGPAKGAVEERVMPKIPEKASRSIRGKVNVKIRVSVNRSGEVTSASIDSEGGSRYFAQQALVAARKWRFKPAHHGREAVPSVWLLRFQFRRDRSEATPTEVSP